MTSPTAIVIDDNGGPDVLRVAPIDVPQPAADEVVVEVAAAGINFVDTYQRSGLYPLLMPGRLGVEGAGTVIAVGSDVRRHKVGDRVTWARAGGSYASHVAVKERHAVAVPDGLALDVAVAAMLQGMTAHFLTHSTHPLTADDTVLAFAAAGGVGRLLVQMAKHRGAKVIACTSTADKADQVRALGADEVLLYRDVDVVAEVKRLTDGDGVDVVYDSVGQATFDVSLQALRARGLLVVYGQASGPIEPVNVLRLAGAGSVFLTRPRLDDHVATASELEWRAHAVLDAAAQGRLQVAIHHRYPLAEAAQAHRDLESGQTAGKLLLIP